MTFRRQWTIAVLTFAALVPAPGAVAAEAPAAGQANSVAFDYGAVPAIPVRPSIVRPARRITGPDPKSAAKAYPKDAYEARLNGAARFSCLVSPDGRLKDCFVQWVSHPGHGFGAAAMTLVPQFVFEPAERDGVPLYDERVYQIVNFTAFADAPSPSPPPQPPRSWTEPGSYVPAPAELESITLPDGPLTAIGRTTHGFVLFITRDSQPGDDGLLEVARVEIFAYPTGPVTYEVHRLRVNCGAGIFADLGSRSFDSRGNADGWRLSPSKAFRAPLLLEETAHHMIDSLCLPSDSRPAVTSLAEAMAVVRAWPRK